MSFFVRSLFKPNNVFKSFLDQSTPANSKILCNSYFTDGNKQKEFQKQVEEWDVSFKKDKTSKAMKAYLERAKEHDEFIKKQQIAYNIGKRHLANMMGEDPATFTQKDVEASIEYLFPSGLYDPRARPIMRPPEQVYPPKKEAEFDESGRPHHFLFYTAKPNFYQVLYDMTSNIKDLEKYHDKLINEHVELDTSKALDMNGYFWLKKDDFEKLILENVMDKEYDYFIQSIERFVAMPYSNRYKEFFDKFRRVLQGQKKSFDIATPQYDQDGRAFVTTYECLRKAARGDVTIRSPGTGKFTVNGKDITYFQQTQSREQVLKRFKSSPMRSIWRSFDDLITHHIKIPQLCLKNWYTIRGVVHYLREPDGRKNI